MRFYVPLFHSDAVQAITRYFLDVIDSQLRASINNIISFLEQGRRVFKSGRITELWPNPPHGQAAGAEECCVLAHPLVTNDQERNTR
jgi:hypothetical protein